MGILVVDKPQGFTSFDVVAKLRGLLGTRKIGHGGTLDPMATGVLPIFIENAAKAVDMQPCQDKTYEATLQFGLCTDTGDITGTILQTAPVTVGEAELLAVLPQFLGVQQQLPPMYSAVKIAGKPLYKYAREGKTVERKQRSITIYDIEYLGTAAQDQYILRVQCSKGTYIRTLMEDIGRALGMPATLAALRRTKAGCFALEQAYTIKELQQAKNQGTLESLLVPVSTVFEQLPRLQLDTQTLNRLLHGAPTSDKIELPGRYAAFCDAVFVGVVQVLADGALRPEKLFYSEAVYTEQKSPTPVYME